LITLSTTTTNPTTPTTTYPRHPFPLPAPTAERHHNTPNSLAASSSSQFHMLKRFMFYSTIPFSPTPSLSSTMRGYNTIK